MKSYADVWRGIVSEANLRDALRAAVRGKRARRDVAEFVKHADVELARLGEALCSGGYWPGPYSQFVVHEPKTRVISCAPFRDRVVHHALCAVVGPLLERRMIADSYACRRGKGTHRAVRRAWTYAARYPFFLKLDVRSFFDSIDHDILLGRLLLPMFREREVRQLLERIVRTALPSQTAGKGLPIGNLTSQWFANLYLDALDHSIKERWRVRGYVRYMDDLALFGTTRAELWRCHDDIAGFLSKERALELKVERTVLAPCTEGVPFLGMRLFPHALRLRRERFVRTRRRHGEREQAFLRGEIDGERLAAATRARVGILDWFGLKGILHAEASA